MPGLIRYQPLVVRHIFLHKYLIQDFGVSAYRLMIKVTSSHLKQSLLKKKLNILYVYREQTKIVKSTFTFSFKL